MSYDGQFGVQLRHVAKSQSLWNRAMSYDPAEIFNMLNTKSQSLWNRAMSYDL